MIKNLLGDDDDRPVEGTERQADASGDSPFFDPNPDFGRESTEKEDFVISVMKPDTLAETTRKSGLATSIGIVLVASVGFLMVVGWGADLLFGSSPWGLVCGIVIGSLIGFVQIFRISSQIFPK